MAQDPPPPGTTVHTTTDAEGKKMYLWSRSTNGPVGEGAPGSPPRTSSETPTPTTPTAAAAAAAPKPDPKDFQSNFPMNEHGHKYPTVGEAVKSIKAEDFANVTQVPCARGGFLAGIASGFGAGGLRLVFRGTPAKAANWAVGSFIAGAAGYFEYCQFQRRQERIRMKRTVEVYQESMAEKRRRETEALEKKKQEQEAIKASQKSWYKFW